MNRYSISRITYSNFKHIPTEAPTSFSFTSSVVSHSLTILDGPNGYGKTTLFEAIELLLTGEIKSFRGDLKSRGLDDYRLLASDAQHPMVFKADMKADNGPELHIERTWNFSGAQASNEITINGSPASQKDLETILKFNKSLFDLGMYISQKESLSFLQNKYKDRGQQVTEILDTSFIDEKLTCLENIKALLTERCNVIVQPLENQLKGLNIIQSELKMQIEAVPYEVVQPPYEKLFAELDFSFDRQDVDVTVPYVSMIEPLKKLKDFSEQYDAYQAERINNALDELINWNQNTYIALFNIKFISLLKNSEKLLSDLHFIQKASTGIRQCLYPLDCRPYASVGVNIEDIEMLQKATLSVNALKNRLGERETALQQIMDSRARFIATYSDTQKSAELDMHRCPLCGTRMDDLLCAIKSAELELRKGCSDLQRELEEYQREQQEIGKRIDTYFQEQLTAHKYLLYIESQLIKVKDLDIRELEQKLKKVDINNFYCNEDLPSVQTFEIAYSELVKALQSKKLPCTVSISHQDMITYTSIHNNYYNGDSVHHTPQQLHQKIVYITFQYTQKARHDFAVTLNTIEQISGEISRVKERYGQKIATFDTVLSKYKQAQVNYNNAIQQALCVPIYIFSGKIIQNYPLGLGIYAEIDAKKIVLTPEKKGDDVYNVLSAGQLNGLALAVLLAVHTVYGKGSNLNTILIDDPLQTIDELSSISLTDLLAEQLWSGQLILSTHELNKAELFQYKFEQSGYAVNKINMQQAYLEQ